MVTRQEGDTTSRVWLNGEFHTKPWTQTMSRAPESPPDQIGDEVSDLEPDLSDSKPGYIVPWLPSLWDRQSVRHHRWLPESGVLYFIYQLVSYQMS